MLQGLTEAGLLTLAFLIPLLLVVLGMPAYINLLVRSGRVLDDAHKVPVTKVPSPAGPLLFLGALAGEVLAYVAFGSLVPVAVAGAAAIAFAIGLTDDLWVLGAKTKPVLLTLASVPLIICVLYQPDLYQSSLALPILGATSAHFTIYTALVVLSFPVVANAFNMMDSFNGEISGFAILTSVALLFALLLQAYFTSGFSVARLAAVLPLVAISAGFYLFNRFPSKVFDGDSGALMLGAMFAAIAITGGVEMAAMVAIVPAILNSFYILSSVRGLVERREMRARPIYTGEDSLLYASQEKHAPATLVRMLLLDGPMTEKRLVRAVLALTAVACLLSGITSVITWVL